MNKTYALGHNQFSHLSYEDWKIQIRLGSYILSDKSKASVYHFDPSIAIPDSIDWVELGAVTSVKDQGECGSCWTFSTVGALEGAYQIKYKDLVEFSEQQLVDCDNWRHGGRDHGCNGGKMEFSFDWVQSNGGLCTLSDYPYTSGDTHTSGKCQSSHCTSNANVSPKDFYDIEVNSDLALMQILSFQPVSVAIEADQKDFQLYKSGVFTGICGTNLDHGVLAVGYGTSEDGIYYYKLKNSWGSSWGENGYIRIQRAVDQKEGQCGILSGPPSFPSLN